MTRKRNVSRKQCVISKCLIVAYGDVVFVDLVHFGETSIMFVEIKFVI